MKCLRCGVQNEPENLQCDRCGSALRAICVACGHANHLDNRFCGQCSAALSFTRPGEAARSSQKILDSLSTKGGEKKVLTVLFADIRDSTRLLDGFDDPEMGLRRLAPVLALMKDAVRRYDGIVNIVQGDGIMALFGAPRPHEDHAVRGCLAAIAMQDAVARLEDSSLRIRVGLHTGEVIVQTLFNDISQTYNAGGTNVHVANRMEQLADAGTTYLTGETYAAAKQFVEVEPLGSLEVRGIANPIPTFKLVGLRNARASEVFRTGRRLSPLIGRDDQLAALELGLDRAAAGDGHVVGMVGEAGIGKSRLCFEFAEHCRRKGIRVFEARVLAHGRATPFQPVLDLLREFFDIRLEDDVAEQRRRVVARFSEISTSDQQLGLLLDFLGLANPSQGGSQLDPKARKMQLLEFVANLARLSPRHSATVVLIEDMHWIDAASQEFVEALADAVLGTTTLLVLNFRPDFSAPFMQRSHYRQINMPPLATNHAVELLHDHFGNDPSLSLLSRNIIVRAQGNPFFLEELVSVLAERGDFEGERGAYRLKGGIESIPLPATVQSVVAARIDGLDDLAKLVLETASVIGREVPRSILAKASRLSDTDVSEAMLKLRQAELLYDVPPYERGVSAFRHPLIQDVAYRSLLRERRRAIHAAVAHEMEQAGGSSPERTSLLAYHLEEAGENLKSAQQNMRAAIWIGANDPSQALRCWKKVRELLVDQPPSKPTDYLRMMACGQVVNFGWREGVSAQDAEFYFKEARDLAVALGDMRANALINAAYGRILANGGSADEYVTRIREAKALAEAGADASVQITLKAVLCHALRCSGRMSEALQANIEATQSAHEIVEFERKTLGFDIEVWLAAMRGQTLVMLGRGEEARPFLDRVLNIKEGEIDTTHHVIPSLAYVDLAWAQSDPRLAREHADRAFSLAVKSASPYLLVYSQAGRGVAHSIAGNHSAAIEDLSSALRLARSRKAGLENEARILADLANAHRMTGNIAAAQANADEAIRIAMERHTRGPECLARIVRAHVLMLQAGSHDLARHELDRAKVLMDETGLSIYQEFLQNPDFGTIGQVGPGFSKAAG